MIELMTRVIRAYPSATMLALIGSILFVIACTYWMIWLRDEQATWPTLAEWRWNQRQLEALERCRDHAVDDETKNIIEDRIDHFRYRFVDKS